jgi:hypothetical protein
VAIARHGKGVAYLRSAHERSHRQPAHELVAKIAARVKTLPSRDEDAVDIIRRMHDGEWD